MTDRLGADAGFYNHYLIMPVCSLAFSPKCRCHRCTRCEVRSPIANFLQHRVHVSNYFKGPGILALVTINPPNIKSRDTLGARGHLPLREIGKALPKYALVFVVFIVLLAESAVAQITLRGMVLDSASMYSLPDVNITIKNTGPGTVSDLRGSFELRAREKDTIVFSRVGYQTRMLPAESVNRLVLIFMKEERRMLDEVEVEDQQPSWLQDPPPVSPWQNPTFNRPFTEAPGFQGVQTFGPGYVFKMPGSGFKKEARAKQRLRELEAENDKAKDYIHMVNSAEIKGKLMKEYGLSEDEYYNMLARFNEKNGDFIYKLEGREVIPLLLQFFATETKPVNNKSENEQ